MTLSTGANSLGDYRQSLFSVIEFLKTLENIFCIFCLVAKNMNSYTYIFQKIVMYGNSGKLSFDNETMCNFIFLFVFQFFLNVHYNRKK